METLLDMVKGVREYGNINWEKAYIYDCIINNSLFKKDTKDEVINGMALFISTTILKSEEDLSIGRITDYVIAYWEEISTKYLTPRDFLMKYGIDIYNGAYNSEEEEN